MGGWQDVFPPSAAATGISMGLRGSESFTDKERVVVVDGEDVVTIETEPPIRDCHARDPSLGVFPPSAVVSPPSAAATGFGMGGRQDVFPPSAAATVFGMWGQQDVFPPSVAAATDFSVGGRQDVFPPSAAATGISMGLEGSESFTDEERVVVVDGEDVVTIETEPPIHDCHARDPGLGVFPPSAVVFPPSAAATVFGVGGW
uniref:Uncharacterized protein n=1 Tax=Chromera velia CCMP2878 TaxID=1169474 RepID=A0A0G4FE89_9ALVE|eukprot:Cvel_16452.t1-p1 / transcript=Cvel_16452.t1 / gene=Cvel_16452 / organism=Chromera_velia_CCMP2878 / gene_product=hypothetical protein / transcript_product=hypothetical protein / location=Cvel_scaffold1268:23308-23910(+) / protein_length=201 / sequence_SO=supercontig / SO=protein_coding / is_pseudo=false